MIYISDLVAETRLNVGFVLWNIVLVVLLLLRDSDLVILLGTLAKFLNKELLHRDGAWLRRVCLSRNQSERCPSLFRLFIRMLLLNVNVGDGNLSLRVLHHGRYIVLHLLPKLKHVVVRNNSLLFNVAHNGPRQVEVFESLTELMEVQMRHLVVDQHLLQMVDITNHKVSMCDLNLLLYLIPYLRHHYFLAVLLIDNTSIMISMIIGTFKIAIAFFIITWLGLVV